MHVIGKFTYNNVLGKTFLRDWTSVSSHKGSFDFVRYTRPQHVTSKKNKQKNLKYPHRVSDFLTMFWFISVQDTMLRLWEL